MLSNKRKPSNSLEELIDGETSNINSITVKAMGISYVYLFCFCASKNKVTKQLPITLPKRPNEEIIYLILM